MKLDIDSFVKTILPRYKKNLYEWKEDVLRPRLMLERMCRKQVACSEEDLRKVYESLYGEKLECRMILWPPDQEKQAQEEYARLRDSEEAFAEKAKKQPLSSLASSGGKPWCGGISSGTASGWPATDWLEEAVLGTYGGQVYDDWISHKGTFSSSQIQAAMKTISGIQFTSRARNQGRFSCSGLAEKFTPFCESFCTRLGSLGA